MMLRYNSARFQLCIVNGPEKPFGEFTILLN